MHQYETLLLKALPAKKTLALDEAAAAANLSLDGAMRAAAWLSEKKFVDMKEESSDSISLSSEAIAFCAKGFPEINLLKKAEKSAPVSSLDELERRVGMAWAARKKWIEVLNGKLSITEAGKKALETNEIASACEKINERKSVSGISKPLLDELISRKLIEQKASKTVFLTLTSAGEKAAKTAQGEEPVEELNALTKELIASKDWKSKKLRSYDIKAPSDELMPGKRHMLARMTERVRAIFAEMGFEEMEGSLIESSFWNFDALFQPQDHPARDLADTFYLKGSAELPDKKIVEAVKDSHEKGWGYKWNPAEAQKLVLRTHTTAVSAKTLSKEKGDRPKKYFCVGRVYRNEATDFKHLAEFHQVEGIVYWEKTTFRDLLGFLKEFFAKLGFSKVRFRPSFFPYTEPSLEIEVYFEERGEWMEIGGAGIMRPEVTLPLFGKYPVLAWGLSLERPLMLLNEINDIRTFYKNDLGWVRSARVKE